MKHSNIKNFNRKETYIMLIITFVWNEIVYIGARMIARSWHHYDMTTHIDNAIPFVPWTILIYLGCYIFWCINYCICAMQDTKERHRFFCAENLAKSICFILFLAIPTTNIRPLIDGSTIWDSLVIILYNIDSADNLFPSIHCLVSWFCWIGVRKNKSVTTIYRYFSLAMALAVCISTLTLKQHVIFDVIGGVLLAEICYYLSGYHCIRKHYTAFISWLMKKNRIH